MARDGHDIRGRDWAYKIREDELNRLREGANLPADTPEEEQPDQEFIETDDDYMHRLNWEFPDEEYEKKTISVAEYTQKYQQLEAAGWEQMYTVNDEIVKLARKRV